MTLLNSFANIDFGTKKQGADWYVINDTVMGGRSASQITIEKDALKFTGNVSLENNGGFVSLRAPFGTYDLTSYSTVSIQYKSPTHSFAMMMETDELWYVPYFKQGLPLADEYTTITLQLADFEAYRIGQPTGELLTQSRKNEIIRLGFINNDKTTGHFELSIKEIQFK